MSRSIRLSAQLAGEAFNGTYTREGSGESNGKASLAKGIAGTLSVRTDNDTGSVALPAGHGQVTGTFCIFWDGGYRHSMTGTVTGDVLALDAGVGDNLPIATTPVVIDAEEVIDFDSTAATVNLAVVGQKYRAAVLFQQENGTLIFALDLGRGNDGEPFFWASGGLFATPFSANVGKISVANGSTAGVNKIVAALQRA